MKLHESLNLDAADTRRRERAAQWITAMCADLATLEHYIANADAEALRGNYWCEVLQQAELATKRALRTATHDGQSTINPREFHGKA